MTRKIVKYALIAVGLLYVLMPRDFIPDVGFIGRLDDLLFVAFLFWRYRVFLKSLFQEEQGKSGTANPTFEKRVATTDPYSVLGVNKQASPEEIDSQFKKLMGKYHPDKVHHLGDEFQKIAHDKSIQIQRAYQMLKKAR